MGTHYVALNHDRKEGFATGKCISFCGLNEENYENFTVVPKSEQEMIDYVWSEIDPEHNFTKNYTYADAQNYGARLWKFGVQECITTDDVYDDDKYKEYTYVDSIYDNDTDIGTKLDDFDEDDAYKPDTDGPVLQGKLGVLQGITITCSESPSRPVSAMIKGWRLVEDLSFVIKHRPKHHSYVSKRRIKKKIQKMQAERAFLIDVIHRNDERIQAQAERIANILQG